MCYTVFVLEVSHIPLYGLWVTSIKTVPAATGAVFSIIEDYSAFSILGNLQNFQSPFEINQTLLR